MKTKTRRHAKPYTTANLILDVLLTMVTGGIWLIVIVIREIKK